MKRHAFLLAGFVALALSAVAKAKDKPHLSVRIDATQIGQPPDQAATARDLATVLATQSERTPDREERAIRDAKQTLAGFLKGMNTDVDKRELKKASRLFKEATAALEEALAPVKSHFERPRPFRASAEIKTCATNKLPPSSSFPSTHAGTGTLFAALLAHVAPERKAELEARGLDYGWSRVVCGFHYPSDIEAGRKGGRLVAEALLKDPTFTKRLDDVAPALRKALGL
ncbi:phosphatase PAP2 family protein [Microvirga terricola]|uniref:Phosphatase PAP2 family protein n=1 Tax=Microvirga terricola TaxID=2719797 RepID=A0ABX0VCX5_9HYPH|nr:phosphatase PAP2 family protein [Microvirga terricola]NIX77702.1 phosphatase PAP2 family protein [Microvirga terricola]